MFKKIFLRIYNCFWSIIKQSTLWVVSVTSEEINLLLVSRRQFYLGYH